MLARYPVKWGAPYIALLRSCCVCCAVPGVARILSLMTNSWSTPPCIQDMAMPLVKCLLSQA